MHWDKEPNSEHLAKLPIIINTGKVFILLFSFTALPTLEACGWPTERYRFISPNQVKNADVLLRLKKNSFFAMKD